MKKVLLRAPVLSQSGYGVHSRQIARWLLGRSDVDLTIHPVSWGITPWYIDASACDGLIGKIMEKSKDDKGPFDVSVQIQLPNEWTRGLAKKDVGVTAGVETTICNPTWVNAINGMSGGVIVPSTFVKNTFEKSASVDKDKLHVIPEAFFDAIEVKSNLKYQFDTSFNFLLVGQLTANSADVDRKNIFNTLKWFCETFHDDKDVGLIIKTNNGRETKIDRKLTTDIIRRVISQVRKGPYPRIHLLHGHMNDVEVVSLYKDPTVKAFVSLTRGEGFGLPILEAAASGIPIIATNWSGHLDFLKFGKFIKVDFELKPVPVSRVDGNIFVKDARWAEPTEEDVKRKLLKFREKPEIPTQWAVEMREIIQQKFSYTAVSKLYDEFWENLK